MTHIYVHDDKEWEHFSDFLWCHRHQLKCCLYKYKHIHMYRIHSFILHASCFRIYIYTYIYAIVSKKMYVIFVRAMWTLINIMQMHSGYVSVIIESMNARVYYYKYTNEFCMPISSFFIHLIYLFDVLLNWIHC